MATKQAVRRESTSTVGRGKTVSIQGEPDFEVWKNNLVTLQLGDSHDFYSDWPKPTVIVSDGGYGVLGFEGDTSDHFNLPQWYEPHVEAWSKAATPQTTLWFWNSEIGWAAVHPILEKHGWRYQNCNIWNKGKAHIAGNVNTGKIRRFPVVSEVCVQYVFEARVSGKLLKEWLRAAVRKYLDQGHLWYYPPPEMFVGMQEYANEHGDPDGRPYFSIDGRKPGTARQWAKMRSKFNCPHGFTNVWDRSPVNGAERIKAPSGKAAHLNQKPLDLMTMIIESSSDKRDVVWEPFGGLFTAALAALYAGRRAFAGEIDPAYFVYGVSRFTRQDPQPSAHPSPLFQGDREAPA